MWVVALKELNAAHRIFKKFKYFAEDMKIAYLWNMQNIMYYLWSLNPFQVSRLTL